MRMNHSTHTYQLLNSYVSLCRFIRISYTTHQHDFIK